MQGCGSCALNNGCPGSEQLLKLGSDWLSDIVRAETGRGAPKGGNRSLCRPGAVEMIRQTSISVGLGIKTRLTPARHVLNQADLLRQARRTTTRTLSVADGSGSSTGGDGSGGSRSPGDVDKVRRVYLEQRQQNGGAVYHSRYRRALDYLFLLLRASCWVQPGALPLYPASSPSPPKHWRRSAIGPMQ